LRLFSSRYLVVILPPLFLLVGLSVQVLRLRVAQVLLAIALIGLALTTVPLYYRSAQVEDWNSTAHWVEQHYQSGDGLVCYDNSLEQGCQVSIEYYLHAYPSAAHFTPDSPGSFSWQKFGPADTSGPDAAVDPNVLATFGTRHPHLFFIVGRARDAAAEQRALIAQQWLDQHYQRVGQIVTRTVTVYLYATHAS
jgi:4-amino-4-deoxy-L-arabinose transferase-like glycosyltransferase